MIFVLAVGLILGASGHNLYRQWRDSELDRAYKQVFIRHNKRGIRRVK